MPQKVYIRGKSLLCSEGGNIDTIISSIENQKINAVQLPVQISGLNYTRPYYMISRDKNLDYTENFYNILYSPIQKAILDADLTKNEIEDLTIFFGSTSMDMPLFEQEYKKSLSKSCPR